MQFEPFPPRKQSREDLMELKGEKWTQNSWEVGGCEQDLQKEV